MKDISNVNLFMQLIKDPERKSLITIFFECIYLLVIYREIPVHYFSRFLFKKNMTDIKNYLPNKFLGEKISVHLNDQVEKEVLDNKLYFDFYYKQFDISIPKTIMYNFKYMFVYVGKNIEVKKLDEFTKLLELIFTENPDYDSIFIKKTNAGSGGFDTYKLFRYDTETNPLLIDEIYRKVTGSGFLFQEVVAQREELSNLNPSCLNTIRIDTYRYNGSIEVISAYIRMSVTNMYIDNISSGGCQVGIDLKSGRLKKFGYAPIKTNGVKVFTEHPLTGIVFENYTIPAFDEVVKTAVTAAKYSPGLRIVGWDIAIGPSGPVLIEGNSDYDITGNDLVDGGYLANPVFRKVLREVKHLKADD
jgi:hypothetical protein